MNIFLIGFMGSGKSSLGKKLSKRLNRNFVDLDNLIEEKEGRSVADIFTEKGESVFRKIEKSTLLEQTKEKDLVVSLGGGACCNEESWEFLEKNGIIIYLKEDNDILLGRLRANKSKRPLISNLNDEELSQFIYDSIAKRSYYYNKANFIYEKRKSSLDFLIKQIERYME